METIRQDYFFWRMVHYLVFQKKYRLLEQGFREVWLEDENMKPRRIVRLVRVDIDFSSWVKRDVLQSVKQFELVRKQLRLGKLEGENIYISVYPPVDSWDDINKPYFESRKKRTIVSSSIIDSAKANETELPPAPILQSIEEMETAIFHLKEQIRVEGKRREEKEKSFFFYGKPFATVMLLIVISIMFYFLERHGSSTSVLTLIEFGAKYNPLIEEGEWWRLISAMFLHIGFLHLFMNSLALFYLGSAVERMFGTGRFLFIYFIAGVSGSLASFAFNEQVAAGASGAIFGCFGALLYFGIVERKLFFRTMGKSVVTILIINLVFGFAVPMVDNGAHIGGLIGGFLASFVVQLPKLKHSIKQLVFLGVTFLYVVSLYWFGGLNEHKASNPILEVQIGQEYLQKEEYELAYPHLQRAVNLDADLPEATFLLAYAEAMFENYERARELLLQTISLRSDFHEAHYNLALVYYELGEIEEARAAVSRALELYHDDIYLELEKKLK
ncbi:rhomboid family intramembrane serine protease [Halalkalibacter akibai]|uniref:Rhomboid family serine protease n=1 Tax=Halalkalibacter akibai (strain ATCC 43226 / DSM 21942 / CIP 109018 / JCM 9157 / 1139) TaxID=1236973 RepID=W4QQ60_HALA3|nr:rhomboid family intramembrane serine protease [Halalkalibacter akibai]GAE33459.1 rhomboid family serine protease [Halalkalibacter akibai JCM 9157]